MDKTGAKMAAFQRVIMCLVDMLLRSTKARPVAVISVASANTGVVVKFSFGHFLSLKPTKNFGD